MEDVNEKTPVEQPEQTSGKPEQTTEKENQVAYETYQKVLKEAKAAKERAKRADELEAQLRQREEEELEKKGNYEELLARAREEANKFKDELKAHQQKYAWKTLTSKIELKAKEMGCKDPTKLIRLMDDSDLKSIQIGEDLSIDSESLESVLEKAKKENDFLFGDSAKKFVNGTPTQTPKQAAKSHEEIYSNYIETLK
jgi:hypothetical protein